ncbi:MAG: HDOD domain-containing protein, partial [Candidatus Promineifilaceae bacterium]
TIIQVEWLKTRLRYCLLHRIRRIDKSTQQLREFKVETTPESLVSGIDRLVSLPEVSIKINLLLMQGDYSSSSLADIIAHDSDISARLLRLVNSSFYGLPSKIDTIQRAVTVAGAHEVRNLVMATTAMRTFSGIPGELIQMEDFWRHAVMTGVLAQTISERCHTLHSDRLFVAGMLHDLGRLVIYLALPDKAKEILFITGGDEWILAETEQEILGFSHTDVGAELFKAWGLPESFQSISRYHHQPQQATDHQHDIAIVHIALAIARGQMVGFSIDEMLWAIEPSAWDITGLNADSLSPFLPDMLQKSEDAVAMFTSPGARKTA